MTKENIEKEEKANNFKNHIVGHEAPRELIELYNFDKTVEKEYAQGFELLDLGKEWGLRTYSEDSIFISSLVGFAQASHSGSTYAFWITTDKDLNTAPIVVFGDEGGYHVVAENFKQLLMLLSCDVEPTVSWDNVLYSKDGNEESSPGKMKFHEWLAKTFGIDPTDDANSIVENAQNRYGQDFKNWMKQYVK